MATPEGYVLWCVSHPMQVIGVLQTEVIAQAIADQLNDEETGDCKYLALPLYALRSTPEAVERTQVDREPGGYL